MIDDVRRQIPVSMPTIICLCGSTRFAPLFHEWNLRWTLAGKIVVSIGADMKSDAEVFAHYTQSELDTIKTRLDVLHLRKIELADEVMILNGIDGSQYTPYIGDSTKRELAYARSLNKRIVWLNRDERARVSRNYLGDYIETVVNTDDVRALIW